MSSYNSLQYPTRQQMREEITRLQELDAENLRDIATLRDRAQESERLLSDTQAGRAAFNASEIHKKNQKLLESLSESQSYSVRLEEALERIQSHYRNPDWEEGKHSGHDGGFCVFCRAGEALTSAPKESFQEYLSSVKKSVESRPKWKRGSIGPVKGTKKDGERK